MLSRADFTTIIAANSDWATFPATIDIPTGWLPLVEKILDTMAAVARETGCRLDIVDIQKRLHQLEFRWRGRIDGDRRAIIRDVIVRAAFRSQGTCEVCGERGWMHVDEFHSGFAVRCHTHLEAGSECFSDKEISMPWVSPERYGKLIYDYETDTVTTVDVGALDELP